MTASGEAVGLAARPYAPSWVDRLLDGIDRLPAPTWVIYPALMIPSVLVSHVAIWASGLAPVGQLTVQQTFWGIWTVGFLWLAHHLDGVAARAFETFRPAISPAAMNLDRAAYELTTIPARPALILAGLAIVFTVAYYVADPVASVVVGYAPLPLVGRTIVESFATAIIMIIFYQGFRQLRAVARIHDAADRVDPFHPTPLYAFSRLTAQTGLGLVSVVALGYVGNPVPIESPTFATLWLPWLVAFLVAGVAIFVLPLLGMHDRLVAAKAGLQRASEERLKSILGELHADVDDLSLARADGLNKLLASTLSEREILARLPTWPWSSGTLRGFVTAILLPLGLFLVQRVLSQLI